MALFAPLTRNCWEHGVGDGEKSVWRSSIGHLLEKLSDGGTGWTTEFVRERDRRIDADDERSVKQPEIDPRAITFQMSYILLTLF
jgi:hypothetical protein